MFLLSTAFMFGLAKHAVKGLLMTVLVPLIYDMLDSIFRPFTRLLGSCPVHGNGWTVSAMIGGKDA